MCRAVNVASYILKKAGDQVEQDMTNLKLQKLLYYCQGYNLALRGETLFSDHLEAWTYGPVVPAIYHKYSFAGRSCIPCPAEFDESSLTEQEKEIIDGVLDMYGRFSAGKLIDMTHAEKPWASVENGDTIEPEAIKDFFIGKIFEDLPADLEDEIFSQAGISSEEEDEEW